MFAGVAGRFPFDSPAISSTMNVVLAEDLIGDDDEGGGGGGGGA